MHWQPEPSGKRSGSEIEPTPRSRGAPNRSGTDCPSGDRGRRGPGRSAWPGAGRGRRRRPGPKSLLRGYPVMESSQRKELCQIKIGLCLTCPSENKPHRRTLMDVQPRPLLARRSALPDSLSARRRSRSPRRVGRVTAFSPGTGSPPPGGPSPPIGPGGPGCSTPSSSHASASERSMPVAAPWTMTSPGPYLTSSLFMMPSVISLLYIISLC